MSSSQSESSEGPSRNRLLTYGAAALAAVVVLLVIILAAGGGDDENDASASSAETQNVAAGQEVKLGDASKVTLRWAVQADGVRSRLKGSGELDNVPYKIEFSEFQFGPPIVEALGGGKVDIGWVGSTPPIFGAAAQTNFRAIAQVKYRNETGARILARAGSGINTVEDLKGKKIAVPKGSNANGLLLVALHRVVSRRTTSSRSSCRPPTGSRRSIAATSTRSRPGRRSRCSRRPRARSESRAVRRTSSA